MAVVQALPGRSIRFAHTDYGVIIGGRTPLNHPPRQDALKFFFNSGTTGKRYQVGHDFKRSVFRYVKLAGVETIQISSVNKHVLEFS